jgi:hypothetical protein
VGAQKFSLALAAATNADLPHVERNGGLIQRKWVNELRRHDRGLKSLL